MQAPSIDVAIQSLPPELREKICKELIHAKQKERSEMGWDDVHEDLMEAYISDAEDQIVADFNCEVCGIGCFKGYDPLCYLCKVTELEILFRHKENCGGCIYCIHPMYLSDPPLDEEID